MLGEILLVAYGLVALVCMVRTVAEGRVSDSATPLGVFLGCLVCLAWLPAFAVLLAYRSVMRPA